MRPFGDRVPAWPPLAGAVALLVAAAVAGLAPLLSALPALAAGLERSAPAIVLLAAVLSAAGVLAVVVFVARLTRPVTAEQLGLRAPEDPARAVLLVLGAAVALAAVAAAWQALGDLRGSLSIPSELDTRTLTAQIYDLPVREPVAFGPGLLASALARCVLPVVAAEVLLRGFAFPALSAWKGPLPAALIVAVLFGGLASLAGQPGVAVLSMLLGLALCGLYLVTGSLLPGIALAATASTVALGVACALPPLGIAALAAGCALAATAIAAAPAGRRHGARGRPLLRGSAA
jgi:membrane protease YdiL (CAAX protease family)